MTRWQRRRFDDGVDDPQASLVNLVDIMLVFICGLIVALVSAQRQSAASEAPAARRVIEQGRELSELPEGLRGEQAGQGMQPVGQVYKDPTTGKLILVGQ
jgi:hypothetical protein